MWGIDFIDQFITPNKGNEYLIPVIDFPTIIRITCAFRMISGCSMRIIGENNMNLWFAEAHSYE